MRGWRIKGKNLLVELDAPDTTSQGGIEIPADAVVPKLTGTVRSVGNGCLDTWSIDQKVLTAPYGGMRAAMFGERCVLIPENCVLACEEEGEGPDGIASSTG